MGLSAARNRGVMRVWVWVRGEGGGGWGGRIMGRGRNWEGWGEDNGEGKELGRVEGT